MTSETHKRIAQRAYALWENAGRPHGRALEHWLQAEAELGEGGLLAPELTHAELREALAAEATKRSHKRAKPSARKRASTKASSDQKRRSSRKR